MSKQIHLVSFEIHSPINHTVLSWSQPGDNRLDAMADLKKWLADTERMWADQLASFKAHVERKRK